MEQIVARHPADHTKYRTVQQSNISGIEPLLVEVYNKGRVTAELPDIAGLRARRVADIERLDAGVRRLINPHIYHVSLTEQLWDLKQRVIADAQVQSQ